MTDSPSSPQSSSRQTVGDAAPGDEIPPFSRTTSFANWNRYAAVNDEFVPIHMDDGAGQAAGYPSAFGMGNLQWAYLHNMLRNWIGDDGTIETIRCQFRSPNLKGQTVTAHGRVQAVRNEGGRLAVDLEVWTTNEDGGVLAPGTATVSVPA